MSSRSLCTSVLFGALLLSACNTAPNPVQDTSSSSSEMMPDMSSESSSVCVNNLFCVRGKVPVCIDGKPTCVDASSASSEDQTSSVAAMSSKAVTPAKKSVSIQNFSFSPAALTVKKGTTVTWTNNDSATHTVTGSNGGPASGQLGNGASYSFTFTTVGAFPYHCAVHPSMTGTVNVTE